MIIALAMAAALSGTPSAQPATVERPLVSREADGSFVIHRPIFAEHITAEEANDGLIAEFDADEQREADRLYKLDRRSRRAADRADEDAFEEAVDMARTAEED
jgi:hypothetical protein